MLPQNILCRKLIPGEDGAQLYVGMTNTHNFPLFLTLFFKDLLSIGVMDCSQKKLYASVAVATSSCPGS